MITIYGYDDKVYKCIPCLNAKRFCSVKNKEYEFISVADSIGEDGKPVKNADVISEILFKLGKVSAEGLTMPQVFVDGKHIGGFNELKGYKFNEL